MAEDTTRGIVDLHVRLYVDDAAALLDAGRRSTARDSGWEPGRPVPDADDPDEVIANPADAAMELLIEGFYRCFRPMCLPEIKSHGLVDQVHGIEDISWGQRVWTPVAGSQPDAPPAEDTAYDRLVAFAGVNARALDAIALILRDPDWGVGMLEDIALILRRTGRSVENLPGDVPTWDRH